MRTLTHLALLVLSTALLFACESTGSGSDGPVSTSATDSATSSDSASSDVSSADAPAGDTAVSTDTPAADTATEVSPGQDVMDATDAVSNDAVAVQDATDAVSNDAVTVEDASVNDVTSDATQADTKDVSPTSDAEPSVDTVPDVATDIPQEVTQDATVADPCEECLANGGTWQPPAGCTQDCNIADLSCFTDACPEPCSAETCGSCFGQEECEAVGCTWNAEGPAMWCN